MPKARITKADESTIEPVLAKATKAPTTRTREAANPNRPLPNSSQDILANASNATVNIIIAPAMSRSARDITNMFLGMAIRATVIIARAPPNATSPLAICSQDMAPILMIAAANMFIATPRIVKLAAVAITF